MPTPGIPASIAALHPRALALAAGLSAVAFAALWARQRRTRDATPVDVAWALAVGGSGVLLAAAADDAPWWRRLLVGGFTAAWATRLAWHLHARSRGRGEDGRYATLRAEKGAGADRWFLGFFLAQAVTVPVLATAFAAALSTPRSAFGAADAVGLGLFTAGIFGTWAADATLERFRADPANAGRTCRRGLWRWSRHPNYFFEWIGWCAWPVLAWGSPAWWAAAVVAGGMLVLLVRVTGIPPAEARALATRGDDYRRYRAATSAFVPWPPRREAP